MKTNIIIINHLQHQHHYPSPPHLLQQWVSCCSVFTLPRKVLPRGREGGGLIVRLGCPKLFTKPTPFIINAYYVVYVVTTNIVDTDMIFFPS